MLNLAARIRELYQSDAVHRSGFRIRSVNTTFVVASLQKELGELLEEISDCNSMGVERTQGLREEMADVLSIVIHLAMLIESDGLLNFNLAGDSGLEALEQRAIEKINQRFR
jgi:NTP pyrophosphatase (non-canonical NTP hydrolase)